jgi:hypothetical protein
MLHQFILFSIRYFIVFDGPTDLKQFKTLRFIVDVNIPFFDTAKMIMIIAKEFYKISNYN